MPWYFYLAGVAYVLAALVYSRYVFREWQLEIVCKMGLPWNHGLTVFASILCAIWPVTALGGIVHYLLTKKGGK